MNIEMEIGMWFETQIDEDGDYIIEMSYDNNGNGLRLFCKKHNKRYIKNLIKQLQDLLELKKAVSK